jgi:hypothetical protein
VATRSRKWWWLAGAILALGLFVECYARSLGDLIMLECPSLRPDAPGHCAHPYWLALGGLVLIGVGLLGLGWLLLRAVLRTWRS